MNIHVITQVYASIIFSEKINLSCTWYMTNYPKMLTSKGFQMDLRLTGRLARARGRQAARPPRRRPAAALPSSMPCQVARAWRWQCQLAARYAIRNETSIGRRVIKTIQQQNDIGVVRVPKKEQNSSVEKGDPQLFRVCPTLYAMHQLVKRWNSQSENLSRRF